MAFRDLTARAAASVGQKMEDEKAPKEPHRALTILCILVVGITADSVNARWHTSSSQR